VMILLFTGACNGDDRSAQPATTTTTRRPITTEPPTTTTSLVDGGEREVLAAYQGYFDAILAANNPPDQFHPALGQYATGEAFKSVFEAAQANRLAGRALRLPENSKTEHRTKVVSIEDGKATVQDCSIDDGLVVKLDSGEVLNDTVKTRLVTSTLVQENGTWKVSTSRVEESWEGVAGCAVA